MSIVSAIATYFNQLREDHHAQHVLAMQAQFVRKDENYTRYTQRLKDLNSSPDALSYCVNARISGGLFNPLPRPLWDSVRHGMPLSFLPLGEIKKGHAYKAYRQHKNVPT